MRDEKGRVQKLNRGTPLGRSPDGIGTFSFAPSPGAPGLRDVSGRLGMRRAVNLGGCLVT
jgi:hypothetical protein